MHEISQISTKFLLKNRLQQPDATTFLKKYFLRSYFNSSLFSKCVVVDCFNQDIEIYHTKKLGSCIDFNGNISVLTATNKQLSGVGAILSAINCKKLPLCSLHHLEFELGNYSPLNVSLLKKISKVDCSKLNLKDIFLGK